MASITSLSVLPEVHRGPFVWQMPFTLKCIGTFRLVYLFPSCLGFPSLANDKHPLDTEVTREPFGRWSPMETGSTAVVAMERLRSGILLMSEEVASKLWLPIRRL